MNVYQFMCVCVLLSPFGFEGGMWDFIVFISDHYLSIYFSLYLYTSEHLEYHAQLHWARKKIHNLGAWLATRCRALQLDGNWNW